MRKIGGKIGNQTLDLLKTTEKIIIDKTYPNTVSLLNKSKTSIKLDKNKWKEIKNKIGIEDDNKAIDEIINKNELSVKQIQELKRKLENSKNIIKDLEKKVNELIEQISQIGKVKKNKETKSFDFEVLEKNFKKLNRDFEEVKDKYNELKSNPIIKEKVVYQENTKIIIELKEKNEKLEAKVREKIAKARKFEEEKKELELKINSLEHKRTENHGLLVRLDKDTNSSFYSFSAEYLNSGEVNKLMRSKRDFSRHKNIKSPSIAILLEEPSVIPQTVFLTSNREKTNLSEISLPMFQYEKLLEFENKHSIVQEELETLKNENLQLKKRHDDLITKYENINQELEKLKNNPIVREKVIYKEDTKQIDDLKLERDFLRSKVLKFEKGTHSKKAMQIEVGEIYKVKIEGIGRNGDAFAKINNLVIFIPNGRLNEEVEIEIIKVFKKYGFARIKK